MSCFLILWLAFFGQSTDHRIGEEYLRKSNFAAAIPYLERDRALDPADYANSYDLALAYLQTHAIAKGRLLVNELIRQSDKAELHNLLGDLEEADGHFDEAAHEYEKAARMEPTEKNLFDLGSDLLNHSGFDPALKVFDFATQRYPQSAKLRVGLGITYYSLGRYDDAVQTLCQAVDLDPRDTKALGFLGKVYDISPKYAGEVSKRLAGFVHIYPDNAAAEYYYALSLRRRAATQTAEPYLLRAIALNPRFTDAHYELGLLYQEQGQNKKGIAHLRIAVQQRPDFVKAHYHLAQLYKRSGQAELARQEFARTEALKTAARN